MRERWAPEEWDSLRAGGAHGIRALVYVLSSQHGECWVLFYPGVALVSGAGEG
jgi:hypothetical protein